MSNGFLHHARRFDDLREEHFSAAEQIANDGHAVHHRAFDDREAFVVLESRFFCVIDNVFVDAFDQCVRQPFFNGTFTPR